MAALSGSMPDARYSAADFLVASSRSRDSCGMVIACMSTTQKKVSTSTASSEHMTHSVSRCSVIDSKACGTILFRFCSRRKHYPGKMKLKKGACMDDPDVARFGGSAVWTYRTSPAF